MARRKTRAITALGIICLLLCLASGGVFVCRRLGYREAAEVYEHIREEALPIETNSNKPSAVDADQLLAMNPDYVFWLEIPGTDISYPVVQTNNNSDYLRTSFTREHRVGGCIFVDAACPADLSGRNTVVYGHRMYDGTMFSGLKWFLDPDYVADHTELRIYLEEGIRTYRFFSVRQTDPWDNYAQTIFESDTAYAEWLKDQLTRSVYNMRSVSQNRANAITLVTCAGDGSARLTVTWILADIQ